MSSTYDLLIVNQSPPYSSANANEGLDLALAAGSFDQSLALLFTGDGVYQLLEEQSSDALHQKNLARMLSALPLYGISEIFADADSLNDRQIDSKDLIQKLNIVITKSSEQRALYRSAHQVIRF